MYITYGETMEQTVSDQQVDDTPNQDGPNYQCPNFPKISCNNGPNGRYVYELYGLC